MKFIPVLLILLSCASLQFGAALATFLFPVAGSWGTTFVRLLFAALSFVILIRPPLREIRSWNRRQWGAVAMFGASLAGMNSFFYASIARLPLGIAVTIEFTGPLVLSTLLSRSRKDVAMVLLAATGLGLLGWDSFQAETQAATKIDLWGAIFALIAGAFWALYILAMKHSAAVTNSRTALPVAVVISAALMAPIGGASSAVIFTQGQLLLIALGMAVFASVIPYSAEMAAIRSLSPNVFGILLALEPIFALGFGALLLGQEVNAVQLLAVACVVSAATGAAFSPTPQALQQVPQRKSQAPQ